jgi:hypothetical protein
MTQWWQKAHDGPCAGWLSQLRTRRAAIKSDF